MGYQEVSCEVLSVNTRVWAVQLLQGRDVMGNARAKEVGSTEGCEGRPFWAEGRAWASQSW